MPAQTEIQEFLGRIAGAAERHPEKISVTSWGRTCTFTRYDLFDDTFIFEDGIEAGLENKDPIVLIPKSALSASGDGARVFGNVMTVSEGNHAVAGLPLLSGALWGLSSLDEAGQADALAHRMVCANCVGDTIEISQRGVSTDYVIEMDEWLQALGLPMRRIVLVDRVDATLEAYAERGQEWRIRPLAWTPEEMENVLRSSTARIHSKIRYYHNIRGVHYLTYGNFKAWGEEIDADMPAFLRGLDELVGTSGGQTVCNLLLPKYGNDHEIEFFGIPAGAGEASMEPILSDMRAALRAADPADPRTVAEAHDRFSAAAETFRSLLTSADYADESSPGFLEAIYRCLSGAVYQSERDLLSRAFDDCRTALPGATYMLGNRMPHEGADARTLALLDFLEANISHGDRIQYVNVYELRSLTERVRLGRGKTREIVYKTMWSPLPFRVIEKRLASRSTGYGAYTLARTEAFRALGISYGRHRLLARSDGSAGDVHYFTRIRYPGEPFNQLPEARFHNLDPRTGVYDMASESEDIVRSVIVQMGSAAAENMILKKYTKDGSTRFAQGKEIIDFGYDIRYGKEMPLAVKLCSVRGTMGWPDTSCTEENLNKAFDFYISSYAPVVFEYAQRHTVLDAWSLADAFWEGFASRTRTIAWNYTSRREQFDAYSPRVFGDYRFPEKWKFALWALERQRERLDDLAERFNAAFRALVGGV